MARKRNETGREQERERERENIIYICIYREKRAETRREVVG